MGDSEGEKRRTWGARPKFETKKGRFSRLHRRRRSRRRARGHGRATSTRSGFFAPRRASPARRRSATRATTAMTTTTARCDARRVGTATRRGRRATRRATTTTIRAAATAPARAVTREECVAFVRRGCKPREAFRCGEENDATPGGAQSAEEGARANGGGRTYGMTLYPDARDGAGRRARMAPRTRGGREGDARDARAFDIDARGGRARGLTTRRTTTQDRDGARKVWVRRGDQAKDGLSSRAARPELARRATRVDADKRSG